MKLTSANGAVVTRAENNDIFQALGRLDNAHNSWVMIGGVDFHLKAIANGSSILLEYLDASGMYRSAALPQDTIQSMFLSYNKGRDNWKSMASWEDVSHEAPAQGGPSGGVMGALKSMFGKK